MTAQTIDPTAPAVGETITTAQLSLETDRETLLSAVAFVSGAAAKRAPLPILSYLTIEPGQIHAFDFETSAVESLPVTGFGAVAVHGDTLAKMVKSLDKGAAVTISASATTTTRERTTRHYQDGAYVTATETYADQQVTATLSAGSVTFDVPAMSCEEMPALPDMTAAAFAFACDASQLSDIVTRAAVAASSDTTMPVLTGARFEISEDGVTVATTDRYRLTAQTFAPIMSGQPRDFLLPIRPAVWAAKQLSGRVSVRVADSIVELSAGSRRVTQRLLDGAFPKYRSLIPDAQPVAVTFNVAAMTKAVKRMSVSLERNAPIRLEMTDGAVIVRAGKSSESVVAVTSTSEPISAPVAVTVGYNPSYLLDGLAFDGAETVTLAMSQPTRPATIRAAGAAGYDPYGPAGSVYLLMPVRLSS